MTELTADHLVPVSLDGGATATVTVISGSAVNYSEDRTMNALGTIGSGQAFTTAVPIWIWSQGLSEVDVRSSYPGSMSPAQLPPQAVTAGLGSAFIGQVLGGAGDNMSYSGATTTGQLLHIVGGTAGSPDTGLNPLLKAVRTINLQYANVTGDAVEQASAGGGIITGTAANQIQTVGWYGIARNSGTTKGAGDSPDACGVYGVGQLQSGGVGVGMGAYFRGQTNSSSGLESALQIESYNNRGSDDSAYTSGFPNTSGIWLWANGPNVSANAITIGNPLSQKFDAGLVFSSQNGGGVASTAILIANTNSKAAISVAQGSGPVILGAATTGFSSAQLDVVNTGAADPIAVFRSTASSNVSVQVQNSVGSSTYFAAGSSGAKFTGTNAGDTGIRVNTTGAFFHIGGTSASVIKVGQAGTLGFYNNTAVVQNSTAFTNTANQAGSFDLPASYTLAQLGAVVVQLIKQLGSNSGVGLVKATTNY